MKQKLIFFTIYLLLGMLLCTPVVLADPTAAPAATPTPTPAAAATPAPTEAPDNLDGIVIRSGDQGDNVVLLQMRLRDLGYFTYKITGQFGSYTANAVSAFQKENGLTGDGVAGADTLEVLYSNNAVRKPVKAVVKPTPTPKKTTSSGGTARKGAMKDWFNWVLPRWSRGEKCKVIDFNTGKAYYMVRVGGSKHADVEPATRNDCAILKSTYGGSWSWSRRAVIVNVDGTWVAGSTNGMPHGYETVPNNGMDGQVCIHFLNSRTHGTNVMCPQHQAMIRRAAGKG